MAYKVMPTDVKVGDVMTTTKSGNCLVIKIEGKGKITVVFKENINHEIITDYRTLKAGHILNPYFSRYYGVGYLGGWEAQDAQGWTTNTFVFGLEVPNDEVVL